MDKIIEKIYTGKLIPSIHSQRDLFGIQLKQTYADSFKTGAKLMLELISNNLRLYD